MTEQINILVIEDRNADFLMIERHLRQNGLTVRCRRVDSLEGLREAIDRESWDLVLSDYSVPQLSFQESLKLLQGSYSDLPVILVSGSIGEEKAVELLKQGVCDFVLKDNLTRLVPAVLRSLREKEKLKEQRCAEERLRESEALYRSLFDNMLNGFACCRMITEGDIPLDFVYLSVNNAFEELTGLGNVVGKRVTEVIPGIRESDPEIFERYGRVALTGKPERFEIYVAALKNWFSISVYSPAREHFIVVFDVITDRKRREEEIKRNEKRLEKLVDILQYPCATIQDFLDYALEQTILLTESKIGYIYNYNEDSKEFVLHSWSRDVMAECAVLNPATCYELDKTGIWGEAVRQRRSIIINDYQAAHPLKKGYPEGHIQLLKFMTVPIFKGASIVGVIGLANKETDYDTVDILQVSLLMEVIWKVIERMQAEAEREELEAQYLQAQKIEAIGQLAGGVAHDFNNILTAIIGHSELILTKVEGNDSVIRHAKEILKSAERATVLTHSLLAFSRKQSVTLTVIDINEVLRGHEAFLRRLIREDIDLKINCSGEVLTVLADRNQIEQVIMNLVTNGRDAMENGGKLVIDTLSVTLDQEFVSAHGYGTAGDFVLVLVSDSGIGMDKETQSRIFEPFFTTKEQGKGTGLGLSMSYGIVKKHGGFINVYSEPGKGTTFKIYLPYVAAAAEIAKMEPKEPAVLRGGTETILLCEDYAVLRKLTVNVLSHYGYRVIEAIDGQDAVEKFAAHKENIDLVIIDAIMPKKNGNVACCEMKTVRRDLKTIFVSGYSRDIFDENNTIDENTIFIHKPYSPIDLLAKVREMLDSK